MKKLFFLLSALLVMCFTSKQSYTASKDILNIQLDAVVNKAVLTGNQSITDIPYFNETYSDNSLTDAVSDIAGLDVSATGFPAGSIDKLLMESYLFIKNTLSTCIKPTNPAIRIHNIYIHSQPETNKWIEKTVISDVNDNLIMESEKNNQINDLQKVDISEPGMAVLLGTGSLLILVLMKLRSKKKSVLPAWVKPHPYLFAH